MKVCKKCKSHVANKAKICKKCGADVSKAKIIKNTNTQAKKIKSQSQTKNINKKTKPLECTNSKNKDQVVVTNKQNKKQPKKETVKQNNKQKYINKIKNLLIQLFSIIKIGTIKFAKTVKKVIIYIIVELFQSMKTTAIIMFELTKSFGKFVVVALKKIHSKVKKVTLNIKEKYSKIKQAKKNKPKELLIETPIIKKEISQTKNRTLRPKRGLKLAFVSMFIITVLIGVYFVGQDIYMDLTGNNHKVIVTEKATTDKVFSMNDIITFNNVDYKVVKIETSKGNSYKSPKEGHQFLIVTVYIKNNSGGKVPYSYENWTMSNSKGEEKKRIFTSINVDTALYSGELVIGGIKTGSMVFEQPINDSKLKMNFYELKKDEDGNEVIDEAKRVFSISVKVPEKKKKEVEIIKSKDDMKVVKTSIKNES